VTFTNPGPTSSPTPSISKSAKKFPCQKQWQKC
jgi:hypothetical protein